MVARTSTGLTWLHHKRVWSLPTGTVERGARVDLPAEAVETSDATSA
jgi:hypothetical protein